MSSSQPTYCSAMKKGPWKARQFDWQFGSDVADKSPAERTSILTESRNFQSKILLKLNFEPPPKNVVEKTRNLSKDSFLQELHNCKGRFFLIDTHVAID